MVDASHLQVLLLVQSKDTLLNSVHGQAGKHTGISGMTREIRQKKLFSINCEPRPQMGKRTSDLRPRQKKQNSQITTELIGILEWYLGPEHVKLIDLISELPQSEGCENNFKALDVFLRYAFAYPVSHPTALNTAKTIIDIMTRHAYLTTLLITAKGSVFVTKVIQEVADVLGITLRHATTRHAQTIGVLERTYATI